MVQLGHALGGVCTVVGEPQNLLIANIAGWDFMTFFYYMAPVTMPVLVAGLFLCFCLEYFKLFGFGTELPTSVRKIFNEYENFEKNQNVGNIQKTNRVGIRIYCASVFDCSTSISPCCCRYYWSRSNNLTNIFQRDNP